MAGIIYIGNSEGNIKTLNIEKNFENNIYFIDKSNWLCDDQYNDSFEITINNGICTVNRLDKNLGWGMHLIIRANLIDKKNSIPVCFINLEKDKDRLEHIQNILNNIFDKTNIYRIEGIKSENSMEGCRLAHIKANIFAINQGFDYYIVCEDDIKPLENKKKILDYINNSINSTPDLVLFEQGAHLENQIEVVRENENMYRIFSGGNNAGCYLCNRNFGIKLVKHWINQWGRHLDHSWQDLWKTNYVYFHRPQLFNQKEGESNQDDVNYRNEICPFNWSLYETNNKYLQNN